MVPGAGNTLGFANWESGEVCNGLVCNRKDDRNGDDDRNDDNKSNDDDDNNVIMIIIAILGMLTI